MKFFAWSQRNFFLSGPVNASYRSKGNKKVIILSDIHSSNATCEPKENQIEINQYLSRLFENNDFNIDFFIEFDWYDIKDNLDNLDILKDKITGTDHISKVRKLSLQYYNKKENKRIHFSDIRKESLSLRKLNEPLDKLISQLMPKDERINFSDNFFQMYDQYIGVLFDFMKNTRGYLTQETPIKLENKILEKEVLKLEKIIGKDYLKVIFDSINRKIKELFDVIFNKENKMSLRDYQYWGFYIIIPLTYIGELYTLSRLMKPEFNNIIIYEGKAHTDILNEFLDILEFNLDYRFEEISENCLNIIPFENYLVPS